MIDTMGYGIHTMTGSQRERYLPLPDYRKSNTLGVHLEVLGRPIDLNYSQLLLERHDLDLDTVILLDRVQKGLPIADAAAARLRKDRLIEGRKPNFHVSTAVAVATETEVSYTVKRGIEPEQLKQLLRAHLNKFPGARRPDIDNLLQPLLAQALSARQKRDKITNLLSQMKNRDQSIRSEGRGPGAAWFSVE